MPQGDELSQKILLSDDEVVAAAVRLGRDWRVSLPTVIVEDPADLLRAAARGHRSLYLRGMLIGAGNTELAPEVSTLLAQAAGRLPEHLGYAAQSVDPYVVAGLRFAVFESASGNKILVVTLPNGINEISEVRPERAREFVTAFAGAPLEGGAEDKAVVLLAPRDADLASYAVITARGTTSGEGPLSSLDFAAGQLTDLVPSALIPRA